MADYKTQVPKNLAVALKQLVACKDKITSDYPDWFQERYRDDHLYYGTLLGQVAEEMERLQEGYGRLYKMLYGD